MKDKFPREPEKIDKDKWGHKHKSTRWSKVGWKVKTESHEHVFVSATHRHHLIMLDDDTPGYEETWSEAYDVKASKEDMEKVKKDK